MGPWTRSSKIAKRFGRKLRFWPRVLRLTLPVALAACGVGAGSVWSSDEVVARWDDRPNGEVWTQASMEMLAGDASVLTQTVPRDAADWCPAYPDATETQRAAFWTGFLSTLSFHESTWNPRAVGGGGRWFGLTQISPATARFRGCEARSGAALQNGELNLRCALRIMSVTVPRDGVISEGMGGVAADWGPLHSQRKREDMRAWLRGQDYCRVAPN